jgi:hypothetical protein
MGMGMGMGNGYAQRCYEPMFDGILVMQSGRRWMGMQWEQKALFFCTLRCTVGYIILFIS